jgi:hypothetical protein
MRDGVQKRAWSAAALNRDEPATPVDKLRVTP